MGSHISFNLRTRLFFFCEPELTTSTGGSFVEVIVFTLVILGAQYLMTGNVTLRFAKEIRVFPARFFLAGGLGNNIVNCT